MTMDAEQARKFMAEAERYPDATISFVELRDLLAELDRVTGFAHDLVDGMEKLGADPTLTDKARRVLDGKEYDDG